MRASSWIGQSFNYRSGQRYAVLRQAAGREDGSLDNFFDSLPDNGRLANTDSRLMLVTGHFPDLDATEMRAAVAAIDADLEPLRAAHPDFSVELTGASVISALQATRMIGELNRGLMLAVLVVVLLLGAAFWYAQR